jgi:DNA-binding NtrC family response regulator
MAVIGQFSDISTAPARVRHLLTNSAHRRNCWGLLVLDVSAPRTGRALNREDLMAQESIRGSIQESVQVFVAESVVESAVVESAFHAPEIPAASLAPNEVMPLLIGSTVGEIERELVLQTLARCDGNRTRAARVLGVSVRTLRNKIRLYSADGIDVPPHLD